MAKLRVGVVSPEREIWSGEADMVIAKTVDGEIGIMPNHAPVLGILVDVGALTVKRGDGDGLVAAVHGGFRAVANIAVSVLAEAAMQGYEVVVASARDAINHAVAYIDAERTGFDAQLEATWVRARLRPAGLEH